MTDAVLFRDPDYGALALIQDGREFVVIDHGSIDKERLMGVFRAQARTLPGATPMESRWLPMVHPDILLANIDRAMRDGGYGDDALGERTIQVVGIPTARTPDLPSQGKVYVSEAVERAVGAQLDAALARIMPDLPGKVESVSLTPFPRPFCRNERTRAPLPFFVARARVRMEGKIPHKRHGKGTAAMGPGTSDGDTGAKKRHGKKTIIELWRDALRPLSTSLVRATVITEAGVMVLEAGVRPPVDVLEAFESAALPAFESHTIRGYRQAHIQLQRPISEEALAQVRARADTCTGAYQMRVEGNVLAVAVPSSIEGYHLGDQAFRDRANWLMQEVAAHDPKLGWVGDMEEGAPPAEEPQNLAEAGAWALPRGAQQWLVQSMDLADRIMQRKDAGLMVGPGNGYAFRVGYPDISRYGDVDTTAPFVEVSDPMRNDGRAVVSYYDPETKRETKRAVPAQPLDVVKTVRTMLRV